MSFYLRGYLLAMEINASLLKVIVIDLERKGMGSKEHTRTWHDITFTCFHTKLNDSSYLEGCLHVIYVDI